MRVDAVIESSSPRCWKALAAEYARTRAIDAGASRRPMHREEIREALEAFLGRENVKSSTHDLNRRHLEM